jgi:hypothetical protein
LVAHIPPLAEAAGGLSLGKPLVEQPLQAAALLLVPELLGPSAYVYQWRQVEI